MLFLGVLGALSGALGWLLPFAPLGLPRAVREIHLHDAFAPLHVPLVFAAALAIGLRRWERTGPPGLLLVALLTVAGWLLAVNLTVHGGNGLERLLAAAGGARAWWGGTLVTMPIAGGLGGLAGAGAIAAGMALVSARCRRRPVIAWTVLLGALVGAVFLNPYLLVGRSVAPRFVFLYVLWQAAVAGSLGRALAGRAHRGSG